IVYTPWSNLKKTGGMDVGQVGFHNPKLVRDMVIISDNIGIKVKKYKIEKRKNEIVNRLNKTKQESYPDLKALREARDKEDRLNQKNKILEEVLYYMDKTLTNYNV